MYSDSNYYGYYKYLESENIKLFTVILLPEKEGKFPVVVNRSPYVDSYEQMDEDDIVASAVNGNNEWLKNGFAMIFQHCRGRGKSSGDCIPYIHEREDGLNLLEWIRKSSFYNGEIFLLGASYTTSVHYATHPFAQDIKGAIFGVQDSERYNICYRNGVLKKKLHASWYVAQYKKKSISEKNFNDKSLDMLPLKNFSKTVFGEHAEDFDLLLSAPDRENSYWNTRYGGNDARGATENVNFPILFTTGFYDIYTGGIFDMWNKMSDKSRKMSALVVSPYDHGDNFDENDSIEFPNGKRMDAFGKRLPLDWFEYCRGIRENTPVKQGLITYYSLFENEWKTDSFYTADKQLEITLGDGCVTYRYDPDNAPTFRGGLSNNFGGSHYENPPYKRNDIVTVYTDAFKEDILVKGKMTANLTVKSDCEDTCFYVRISIAKEEGDFGLRNDITTICFQHKDYTPNSFVTLDFSFDEHAFLIKKGEKLRIDISSADNENFVRHTNIKGLYSEITYTKTATNTVNLEKSYIVLPVESKTNKADK